MIYLQTLVGRSAMGQHNPGSQTNRYPMNLTMSRMSPLRLLLPAALICIALGYAAAPLAAADISKMGPPAKVTWNPGHLTEAEFTDGSATVEFTSNKDVAEVSIVATPSLSKFMTVEPSSISDVLADTVYEVTITLLNPEEPPNQTMGGTIKVKEGNRTLAKPLSVSIKSESEEEDEPEVEGEDGEGEEDEEGDDGEDEVNTLMWTPEVIDASLFGEGDETTIVFTSTKDIEKVCLWVTPSAQGFLTVEPTMISPVLGDGTEYELTLTLSPTLAELPHDVGGTLHVRWCDESGKMRRTYDPPIGIQILTGEEEEPEEADPDAIVSSADFEIGPVAPNEIVSIFGQGLGPQQPQGFTAKSITVDTVLANTQVLFNGTAAPVLATQHGQINTIVPAGVAGLADVVMRVLYNGKISAPYVVAVTESSPALYALDGSGKGQGAILNSDLSINSRSNRAPLGSWIALYGTGGGLGETAAADGEILTESIALALPVEVTINRAPAEVIWAGYPAGSVQGVVQVNVWLPSDPRIVYGDWPVVLKIGGKQSGNDITVAIK